jgi:hypothetical protein
VKVRVWILFWLLVVLIVALRIYSSIDPPLHSNTRHGPSHGHK